MRLSFRVIATRRPAGASTAVPAIRRFRGECNELFVLLLSGPEQFLLCSGRQVHPLEERPAPFRRGPFTGEEDPVPVLRQHRFSVRPHVVHRISGIVVCVVCAQIEQRLPLFPGGTKAHHRAGVPAPFTVVFLQDPRPPGGRPGHPGESPFDLHLLCGFRREGGGEPHHPVPVRNFLRGIPSVQGFHPDQRGGLQRLPLHVPRAHRHSLHRNLVGYRKVRDRRNQFSVQVPHLCRSSEVVERNTVGKRTVDPGDEQVLPVGREFRAGKDPRSADGPHFRGDAVHDHQARRRKMFEQLLVEGVLEKILVGPHAGDLPRGLLHDRPYRHGRGLRRTRRARRNGHGQQMHVVTHPTERGGDHIIELNAGKLFRRAGPGIRHPELNPLRRVAPEGDLLPVVRPGREAHRRVFGELHAELLPAVGPDDPDPGVDRGPLRRVLLRIDPHSRDPQDGARQQRDRRMRRVVDQQQRVAARAHPHERRGRRVQDLHHVRGRDLVRRLSENRSGGKRQKGKGEHSACGLHVNISWIDGTS